MRAGETLSNEGDHIDPKLPRRLTRGDKLGPRGRRFRSALEQFIEKEGNEFARKSEDALRMAFAPQSRMTGTSISGLAREVTVVPDDGNSENDERNLPFTCHVMSSTMPRAVETASWQTLPFQIDELPNLNPLDKGDYSGMELEEINKIDPDWYAMLVNDPFLTRFPGGECYADLIHRLETCIIDMEQQVNMACVVSHVSVLQVLMAYFRRSPVKDCTSIEVPMHTVIKYTPVTGGGWTESRHSLCQDKDLDDLSFHDVILEPSVRTPIWGDHQTSARNSPSESFEFSGCDFDEKESLTNQ